MFEPLVSIIINNYNYRRYLKQAIDSVIDQTYRKTEIIVVDDGSTDGSSEIILEYADLVIPVLKENGGQASAFNAGFKASNGKIIVFLDSDDALLPSAIEKVVSIFDDPAVVKVHWPLWKIDINGEQTGKTLPDSRLIEGDFKNALITNGPVEAGGPPNSPPTSGNAWSRKYLEAIFPMPEEPFKHTADFYLMVLAPLYGIIKKIDDPLGLYRVHGSNTTLRATYLRDFINLFEHCCLALSRFLSQKGIEIGADTWPRNHWFHKVYDSIKDIEMVVAPKDSFVLVDGNDWGTDDTVSGRRRRFFIEQESEYWGLPVDDAHAISEIERQREMGASSIIFTWTAFWMFDYYKGMYCYLQKNYACIVNSERLMGFNLVNKFSNEVSVLEMNKSEISNRMQNCAHL